MVYITLKIHNGRPLMKDAGFIALLQRSAKFPHVLIALAEEHVIADADRFRERLIARYGEEAAARLEDAELRIERHLATLLANSSHAPMPSLRLIQAPVFHGHSFSLWVEFEKNPGVKALEKALSSDPIDVRTADMEPPNNVGVAGQSGIAVGAVTADRNHAAAAWFWMAADNLRLSAENAVALL